MCLFYKALLLSIAQALSDDLTAKVEVKNDVVLELKTEYIVGGCCLLSLVILIIVCYSIKQQQADFDDHF